MRSVAANVTRFVLHFLELQIPMVVGAVVCFLLLRLIPASSSFATVYYPGAYLYTAGDIFFLTVPVVAWMIFRGHGWRHSLEMVVALLAPVAAIIVVGELAGYAYRPWLITAGYPAISLGMLMYMLYRGYDAGKRERGLAANKDGRRTMNRVASTGEVDASGGRALGVDPSSQFSVGSPHPGAADARTSITDVAPGRSASEPSVPWRLIGPILAFARAVNPWVLRLAGRRGVPIAVVRHFGRRSQRPYANPVLAFSTADGFVISLPYGSGVNWCRNVLASSAASIRWQGLDYPIFRAELLGSAQALPQLPAILRPVVRFLKLRQFLRVRSGPAVHMNRNRVP